MILLDTHVWLWWVSNPDNLSEKAAEVIDEAISRRGVLISSISSWEVAMLVRKGRLELALEVEELVMKTEALPFVNFIPVDNHIAVKSVSLSSSIHSDPADRIIMATSLVNNALLITKDEKILSYSEVRTLW
jgi:PIN domain nuclease of toxin-antitoxin system